MSYVNPIVFAIASSPIDGLAGRVASQRRCIDSIDTDKNSLLSALHRLERRQRLLKAVLKIDRPSQHRNLLARLRKNILTKGSDNPRAVIDYVQNGEKIFMYQNAISNFIKQDMAKKAMPKHQRNAAEHGYFLLIGNSEGQQA